MNDQSWIDGYQQCLDDLADGLRGPFIVGQVLWSKDPAVHTAAVERFDTWRQELLDKRSRSVVGSSS